MDRPQVLEDFGELAQRVDASPKPAGAVRNRIDSPATAPLVAQARQTTRAGRPPSLAAAARAPGSGR